MPDTKTLAFTLSALTLSALTLVVLSGCDCTGPEPTACTTAADCASGEDCRDGVCVPRPDAGATEGDAGPDAGPARELVSIAIEPPSSALTANIGGMPTEDFDVIGTYTDGTTAPVIGPTFTIDDASLGFLDPANGMFTANGVLGGATMVHASVSNPAGGELTADASLTVTLDATVSGAGVDATVPALFAGAPTDDAARNPNIVYPLVDAVMPQNVYPADVQWLVGVVGDWFRVTIEKPHVTLTAYLAEDGNHHWLVDAVGWRSLAQTDPDDDATVRVTRYEAATSTLLEGAPVPFRFARAAVTGSVYYWDVTARRIVRINDGSGVGEAFMPTPPNSADGGDNCVGCHSVSNSGRYMAGRLGPGQNIGAVFDLTTDLTGAPAPTVYPLSSAPRSLEWWFSSWNPDDSRIVAVDQDSSATARQLHFYDPYMGVEVPVAGTLPNGTHPAWSPDGTEIAYVANPDAWGGANTTGDIATLDVTAPDTVGANRIIHTASLLAGAIPPGSADSYPTWSPDSARIAFANGTGSRSENMASALYLMERDGTGVVRLDAANGGPTTTNNFQPNFSSFESGGYHWLSFLSRRDYGNPQVGTAGSDFQQIWVTAIRVGAAPGEDGSSVAYWLPGQATTSRNLAAFWAPRACRPDGDTCSVGSECCGGECLPGAGGELVCSPPPPERCRAESETCSTDADCCEGMSLTCLGNVCVRAPG